MIKRNLAARTAAVKPPPPVTTTRGRVFAPVFRPRSVIFRRVRASQQTTARRRPPYIITVRCTVSLDLASVPIFYFFTRPRFIAVPFCPSPAVFIGENRFSRFSVRRIFEKKKKNFKKK